MGCRPIALTVLLALTLATVGAPGLAQVDSAPVVVSIGTPAPALPHDRSAEGALHWVPTVNEAVGRYVYADLSGVEPSARSAIYVLAEDAWEAAKGPADDLGVDVQKSPLSSSAPSSTTPSYTPIEVSDDSYISRIGNPFLLASHDDGDARSVAPGPHTAPLSPAMERSDGAIAPRRDLSTQDSGARLLAAPLVGGFSIPQAAAVAAGLALLLLAPWALYHRIRGNSTLENRTRKQIYDSVCTMPGSGVAEVAQSSGVTYSTASYHLDRLVGAGMLVVSAEGSRLRYYKNGGAVTEEERRLIPVLESAEACRVLEAILDRPWTYRAAIAERLGVSTTTVNWHLKRLLDIGLVQEVREGRSAHLFVDRQRLAQSIAPLGTKLAELPEGVRRILERVPPPPEPSQLLPA